VICATTHAREPVVRRDWLRPGAHLNSVGLHPQGREIDSLEGTRVVVESRASAFAPPPSGANELRDTSAAEAVELGELCSGTRAGRTSEAQITVYKSVGVAAKDAAAAALVLRRARERGIGRSIEL
jgi:ornithine cyclodeaminase